jgi:hypothetical protein
MCRSEEQGPRRQGERRGGRGTVGKDEAPPVVPKPESASRLNQVPAAGPPVKKTIVKKVLLEDGDKEGALKKSRWKKARNIFPLGKSRP